MVNFVGLGAAILCLILGIAAYKIIMGMVGFIQTSLQSILISICVAVGLVVLAGITYAFVEIKHRHKIHGAEFKARMIVIDRIATGQIQLTQPVDFILGPPKGRKAIAPPEGIDYTAWSAEDVTERVPAEQPQPRAITADELAAIEPPPASKHSLDELIEELQRMRAERYAEKQFAKRGGMEELES